MVVVISSLSDWHRTPKKRLKISSETFKCRFYIIFSWIKWWFVFCLEIPFQRRSLKSLNLKWNNEMLPFLARCSRSLPHFSNVKVSSWPWGWPVTARANFQPQGRNLATSFKKARSFFWFWMLPRVRIMRLQCTVPFNMLELVAAGSAWWLPCPGFCKTNPSCELFDTWNKRRGFSLPPKWK